MRIRVLCPGCGRTHGVDPGWLGPTGSEFTCRDCGTAFRVDASGEVRSIGRGQQGPLQDAPRPVERIDPEPPLPGEVACPILIFTARDEEEMYGSCWDELQSLGADDMLIKGMNVGENLLTKVEHLLSERK